jgi:hypothetical protein
MIVVDIVAEVLAVVGKDIGVVVVLVVDVAERMLKVGARTW